MKTYEVQMAYDTVTVEASSPREAVIKATAKTKNNVVAIIKRDHYLRQDGFAVYSYGTNGGIRSIVGVREVIEAPVVEVVAEQVAVKTEQGIVTVDILAAATVEQVAEQVATDAYTAGCDAKYFARTHAARIAKAAGTALTTEVKHLITTVTRRTVDTLDTALMA
jgi:hypothetical protein